MRIVNFGSLNIDHVYSVAHFVRPGETIGSKNYRMFAGGKGANQSIALALAGAEVYHAGTIGRDGEWLRDLLEGKGVDTTHIQTNDGPTGHAIIQVNEEGENAIVLHGGANRNIEPEDAARVLGAFSCGDWLLLQNEISSISEIMKQGTSKKLRVIFNPAPMNRDVLNYPLDCVGMFIVNEIEGAELTGEHLPDKIVRAMLARYPECSVVLTRGSKGALFYDGREHFSVAAHEVTPVDTTAAGDTFIGYFLAGSAAGMGVENALELACKAAALCVTRPGAAESIPSREEVASMPAAENG